jgi:hypothetical protein
MRSFLAAELLTFVATGGGPGAIWRLHDGSKRMPQLHRLVPALLKQLYRECSLPTQLPATVRSLPAERGLDR